MLLSNNPMDGIVAALLSLVLFIIDRLGTRHATWNP
jgi:hypothetical protein